MFQLDLAIFEAMNAGPQSAWWVIAAARWVSAWGAALMGTALLYMAVQGSARQRRAVLLCVLALLLTWAVVYGIRSIYPTPRPAQLGLGYQWIAHTARASFPSMHTSAAFAFAAALLISAWPTRHAMRARNRMLRPLWLMSAAATLLALAMAWSRVSLGVHLPSDVLAGAATGILAASLAAVLLRRMTTLMRGMWQLRSA